MMTQIVVEQLTEEEAEALLLAFMEERGGEGFTEEEAERILDWAEHARLDVILLQMVLKGVVGIDIKDDEIVFTSKGEILPAGPLDDA